jgi:threonyl-tRNA synthetase
MFAILVEHYAGKWPLWLSPRQVMVVPISAVSVPYAKEVRAALRGAGFHAEVDVADKKMQKKVREAQLAQFNYILVVGEAESAARTVNVRTRDNHVHGMHALDGVVEVMKREVAEKSLVGLFEDEDEEEVGGSGGGADGKEAASAAAE